MPTRIIIIHAIALALLVCAPAVGTAQSPPPGAVVDDPAGGVVDPGRLPSQDLLPGAAGDPPGGVRRDPRFPSEDLLDEPPPGGVIDHPSGRPLDDPSLSRRMPEPVPPEPPAEIPPDGVNPPAGSVGPPPGTVGPPPGVVGPPAGGAGTPPDSVGPPPGATSPPNPPPAGDGGASASGLLAQSRPSAVELEDSVPE